MVPINRALKYIEKHLSYEIDIEKLAKASYISKYHMARVFKTLTGYAPMEYVRNRRLTEAAKKLIREKESVYSIGFDVGYSSPAAFTKAFVQRFSIPPSACKAKFDQLESLFVEPILISQMNIKISNPKYEPELNIQLVGIEQFAENLDEKLWAKLAELPFPPSYFNHNKICSIYNYSDIGELKSHFVGYPLESIDSLNSPFTIKTLSLKKCVVFNHIGNAKSIEDFNIAIFAEWLPENKIRLKNAQQIHFTKPLSNYNKEQANDPDHQFELELWIPILE
ncbi:helix-turn-helix domain-containing protein [Aureibacter tunicatorum]|uniref:AraC family transcriptional regulator n=1 Tax=Aureibacter tunicatorum TaxID=866807 RepID=A0AAE4BVI6_9BACT|nr:helix-turn-helix domain-containing protein [Aureibacter tunicatorum]MDR6241917.1 AraC family transcriptional regulator [Aureibacter tunicatorum]BDD07466.1 AraC family transcriptional regulator [Aureibacter tunicatorum]